MTTKTKLMTIALAGLFMGLAKPGEGDGSLTPEEIARKIDATVRTILAEHKDDSKAALAAIVQENYKERGKVREWKDKYDALDKTKPGEGQVVLTKEEAADWAAYQKLGKPDEITKKIEDGTKAAEAVAEVERTKSMGDVAKSMNWNPEVLAKLVAFDGVSIETQTMQVDGKPVHGHRVKKSDGTFVPLEEYAKGNWSTWAPSLEAKGTDGGGGEGGGNQDGNGAGSGFTWPNQGGGGSGGGGGENEVDQTVKGLLDARANVPSPFDPPKK